ncbi:LPD3 domain-containing protein [Novispirillum itersonii]|uniref:LPD3 domain-containing protein n=1 Tax=Novispirillum itersonii TaxID=189 RepID=UPI00037CD591|nr:hypothetical protein [Novispirillum itersonii]
MQLLRFRLPRRNLSLERLRPGNTVQAARTPVLDTLRGQGGVAPGSPLAALLDDVDSDGDFLIAAIHPWQGTVTFHGLKSLYGKDRTPANPADTGAQKWLERVVNAGDVLYMNSKKASGLSKEARVSIPAVSKVRSQNLKMLSERNLVKGRRTTPEFYQDAGIGPRGTYAPDTDVITLFRSANPSTAGGSDATTTDIGALAGKDDTASRTDTSDRSLDQTLLGFYQTDPSAPVEIRGDELAPAGADLKTLRDAATTWWMRTLKAETDSRGRVIRPSFVDHPQLGEIHFTTKGKDKFFQSAANPDRLRMVPKLKEIIQAARMLGVPGLCG